MPVNITSLPADEDITGITSSIWYSVGAPRKLRYNTKSDFKECPKT